jgi:phosphatidylserine/phosphatidylglycerophosphate/cardiolipin synthase-like enzyme
VIDHARAFITSANLTEGAQERNIESGVLVSDRGLAQALTAQFESLVQTKALRRLPGL